jgi:hypothetical protein
MPNSANKCSRAGCDMAAVHIIQWRNPKVHAEDRIKQWAACGEHLGFLSEYLKLRGFYLKDLPI